MLPKKLQKGDTIGLISPAGVAYDTQSYQIAFESLQAMGLIVKEGRFLRNRYGYLAGTDAERATEINEMFADDTVKGILALRGGWGCARILDKIDYELIARKPKILGGFSDLTALINAVYAKTGLVTFHSPMATSDWNNFSFDYFKRVLFDGEAVFFENPKEKNDSLAQKNNRIQTITSGKAKGVLVGGNLAVLSGLVGTPYLPDFRGKILFLEEINEYIYRIDRMLAQLRLAGILDKLSGVVLGHFTDCSPQQEYGSLTLEEVLDTYFKNLGVPVFWGSMIGHIKHKFTTPVGLEAQIDADLGTIRLLSAAVQ